jgi:hypothetical protein
MNRLLRPSPLVLLGALLLVLGASPSAAGIKVAILPAGQVVAPGDSFDVSIEVTEAGSSFNGFDLSIGYDHTALTFVQRSPVSLQEGAYFVAACPSGRFHMFQAGTDSLAITDVLLCAGASVTGPGQIYKLRFSVEPPPGHDAASLSGAGVLQRGVCHRCDHNASVGIGTSPRFRDASGRPHAHLSAAPNPRGLTVLRIDADRAGYSDRSSPT